MDDGNSTTTRLLTLLNVSATKAGKRKRTYELDAPPTEKLNKRKSVRYTSTEKENPVISTEVTTEKDEMKTVIEKDEKEPETDGTLAFYDLLSCVDVQQVSRTHTSCTLVLILLYLPNLLEMQSNVGHGLHRDQSTENWDLPSIRFPRVRMPQ